MLKRISKPWGYYEDIFRSQTIVIKKIVIHAQQRLSLQKHEKRCEYWGIEEGRGKLQIGDWESDLLPSNSVYIPKGTIHRVTNVGDSNLVIYETQIGICDEDDIIRLEDQYGR